MLLPSAFKATAMVLCLMLVSFEAHAISRHTSTSMTCANIQATIRAEGAAIFRWTQKPNIERYGRFVANSRYCDPYWTAQTSLIPSANSKSCPVFECKPYRLDPFFFR